jgi:colanic acid/amylovoran biosynthesis glycosyltransferase
MRFRGICRMTTVAYIANAFPSPIEPYVMDEITELRHCGTKVICCSGKRVSATDLSLPERAFWKETRFFQPLTDDELVRAGNRLLHRQNLWAFLQLLLQERGCSPLRLVRSLGHTLMGAALADQLEPLQVEHIHAHHGYFASWMALVAARLLRIGFSFTLHGSDLLQRRDLLSAKLRACKFCFTISDFNRNYILRTYARIAPEKVIVQRLGVDSVPSWPTVAAVTEPKAKLFSLLSVGRLHAVKNHRFLIQACALLRDSGLDFLCWIIGEGPERESLERQILSLGLQGRVYLIGQVPRAELPGYYRYADLVVLTSKSEGIPVVLMEAMAHEKLVLAPSITGIPELVEHKRTGFLYDPDSLLGFVSAVQSIQANHGRYLEIQRAAAARIVSSYNRQTNLRTFADEFLARISQPESDRANPLLQQIQLSI